MALHDFLSSPTFVFFLPVFLFCYLRKHTKSATRCFNNIYGERVYAHMAEWLERPHIDNETRVRISPWLICREGNFPYFIGLRVRSQLATPLESTWKPYLFLIVRYMNSNCLLIFIELSTLPVPVK